MRMIMGLDNPTSGTTLVNGRRYNELGWPLREVGALLDAKAYHPARSAYDHLLSLAKSNDIACSRIDEVLDIVGLTDVAHQRAGRYSLGMGQRLGIATALLGDPGVLLFDEPINGLDPEGIRWARFLLRDLAAEGRTVFVSSHLINEMALTAERLVVIGRGTLIAETSVREFTAQSDLDAVRVVTPMTELFVAALNDAGAGAKVEADGSIVATGLSAAEIGELAADRILTLHELSPLKGSLEDAFMELTQDSVEYRSGSGPVTHRGIAVLDAHSSSNAR
jgi:ABC-2 type transport system ATP-binding protein